MVKRKRRAKKDHIDWEVLKEKRSLKRGVQMVQDSGLREKMFE